MMCYEPADSVLGWVAATVNHILLVSLQLLQLNQSQITRDQTCRTSTALRVQRPIEIVL